jgi:hypothetical protein
MWSYQAPLPFASTWTPTRRTPPCWKKAARFATEVLLPINAAGDREGCRL